MTQGGPQTPPKTLAEMSDQEAGMVVYRRLFRARTLIWLVAFVVVILALLWAFNYPLTSNIDWVRALLISLAGGVFLAAFGALISAALAEPEIQLARDQERRSARTEELKQAQTKGGTPDQIYATWDVALNTLETYWDSNKQQNRQIFYLSVGATMLGFVVLVIAVALKALGLGQTGDNVSIVAGILSQFIGATFLLVYRSTVSQTGRFSEALERILTAGMAAAMVDTFEGASAEEISEKNRLRGEVAFAILRTVKDRAS